MYEWLLAALLVADSATPPGAEALLAAADRPRSAFLHSTVHVRATTRRAGQPDTVAEFELRVGGADRQLIVFTDPRNRGRRLLLRGDKAWLTTPGTTHPVPVSANPRLAGGASYAEVARLRLAGDYRGTLRAAPEPCLEIAAAGAAAEDCRVLDIEAVARTAPWPAGTLWLDERGLVRRALFRHASGRPARSAQHAYREQDGQPVLARSEITDLLAGETEPSTILEYLEYRREPQPEPMFDPPPAPEAVQSPR
jgi:hypothetical protein